MELRYRKAVVQDAALLIDIYNAAFYGDYIKYGVCPGYGKTKEMMEHSILQYPKYIITCGEVPVGYISCKETEPDVHTIGCLCIIPPFQRKGIGTQAMKHVLSQYGEGKTFILITPADKTENIRFYTEKCGFRMVGVEMDGSVKVVRLMLKKWPETDRPQHLFRYAYRFWHMKKQIRLILVSRSCRKNGK